MTSYSKPRIRVFAVTATLLRGFAGNQFDCGTNFTKPCGL
jgi:hypothetical protein